MRRALLTSLLLLDLAISLTVGGLPSMSESAYLELAQRPRIVFAGAGGGHPGRVH